jgi:outer membrane protein assembly factor BamE (lipoprotein component of BamABCDE complex)
MKNIITLLLAATILLSGCARLSEDCLKHKGRVDTVAAKGRANLKLGMYAQEVEALLGKADETVIYEGEGDPQTWKYRIFPDCKHKGVTAPVTEIHFRDGRLTKFKITD